MIIDEDVLREVEAALEDVPCDCEDRQIGAHLYHTTCKRCAALAKIKALGEG